MSKYHVVFEALNGLNTSDLLDRYEAPRPLRSSGTGLFRVSMIKTERAEAVFSFSVHHLWNKRPEHLRSTETVRPFK